MCKIFCRARRVIACALVAKYPALCLMLVLGSCAMRVSALNREIRPPIPADPPILFHASFDKTIDQADIAAGDPDMVGSLKDRSATRDAGSRLAWAPWQYEKDIKEYRAVQDSRGKIGACLRVPVGKAHRFRALGNVPARAGTISFWVCFDRKLPSAHAAVFSFNSYHSAGIPLYLRVSGKKLFFGGYTDAGKNEFPLLGSDMEVGRWYHIAVVYDCVRGMKVYLDGKLQSGSKWGTPECGWRAEGIFADLMNLAASSITPSIIPMRMDELYVFSKPLSAAAIADLADCRSAPDDPEPETECDARLWRSHRLRELGWDMEDGFLDVASNGLPLVLRKIRHKDARDVKCFRYGAVDGVEETRWPTSYHGFDIPNGGLHLMFAGRERIDYLAIRGHYTGRMYAGLAQDEPPASAAVAGFEMPAPVIRRKLPAPVTTDALSFFRKDGEGRINELSLYRVDERVVPAFEKSMTLYLTGNHYDADQDLIAWSLRTHYEPADRICFSPASSPEPAPATIVLPALRHAHFFVPAGIIPSGTAAVARVRLRLFADDVESAMRLRIQLRDPVDISRTLWDWDCRLAPGKSPAYDMVLEFTGCAIPEGRPFWFILTPENDIRLIAGGADRPSRLELEIDDSGAAPAGRVEDLLHYTKDRLIHVSEPRPWTRLPLDEVGRRMLVFRQLDYALSHLMTIAPDNDRVQSVWSWTHPDENPAAWKNLEPPAIPGAPLWAVHANESMKKYRAAALWWIENLQIPNGLLGSGYFDDTDLVQDWVSLSLICDPDGVIRDSLHRLAEYCWNEGPLDKGINRRLTDSLHAYEEGVNTMPHNAALHYGNPVYLERLMESSRTVRDWLTYTPDAGRRFFKSWWYGSTQIDTEFERGQDILINALLLHPALYLAYYSRNTGAVQLLREWGGSWCDLMNNARQAGKPYPISLRYPDAAIVRTAEQCVPNFAFDDICLGLYSITGEEKYFTPVRSWLDHNRLPRNMPDWMAVRDISECFPLLTNTANSIDWTALKPSMGDDVRCAHAYLGWLATRNKEYILKALEQSWKRIAFLFPMHTWAEQSGDRVALSKTLVDRLYLGGTPGYRNKIWPTHTVSWSEFNEDFAAWALESTPEKLRVWIYNFDARPQTGNLHTWALEGTYAARMGVDANEDEASERILWQKNLILSRNTAVPLTIPPRELVIFEAERTVPGAPLFPRPDIALTVDDIRHDPARREISITVHNVGSAPAANIIVNVALDDTPMPAFSIPYLEAPNDLLPRVAGVTVSNVPSDVGFVEVTIDPGNIIPEIWKGNNHVKHKIQS